MSKIWIVIQREYWSRVQKASFIWATLLTPLVAGLVVLGIGLIYTYGSNQKSEIIVIDDSDLLGDSIESDASLTFKFTDKTLAEIQADFAVEEVAGVLVLPPMNNPEAEDYKMQYYCEGYLSLIFEKEMKQRVNDRIYDFKIDELNINKEQLSRLDTRIEIDSKAIDASKEDKGTIQSLVAAVIGAILGFFIYTSIFSYGMMIMRSISEEKQNRILEVMVSSVKPVYFILGKIIGVGAVGLTQILILSIATPLSSLLVWRLFSSNIEDSISHLNMEELPASSLEILNALPEIFAEIINQNWLVLLPMYAFYFLVGYLLYSSLFAVVGSLVGDDSGEGEGLAFVISLPNVISLFILLFVVVKAPNSDLSFWASLFPLSSPIVMPAYMILHEPSIWHVFLSMGLLLLTCSFIVWISARIYRITVLFYGKTFRLRDIQKIFTDNW